MVVLGGFPRVSPFLLLFFPIDLGCACLKLVNLWLTTLCMTVCLNSIPRLCVFVCVSRCQYWEFVMRLG